MMTGILGKLIQAYICVYCLLFIKVDDVSQGILNEQNVT